MSEANYPSVSQGPPFLLPLPVPFALSAVIAAAADVRNRAIRRRIPHSDVIARLTFPLDGQTCSWVRIKTTIFHGRNAYCAVQLMKGRVSSLYLNLNPCFLCIFPLSEFDCSLCCSSVSCTAEEQGREIQIYAGAGAALWTGHVRHPTWQRPLSSFVDRKMPRKRRRDTFTRAGHSGQA